MSHQNQLPVVPENSAVTNWQQAQAQAPQQRYYVTRIAAELLLTRADNINLRELNKQLQHDAGCWRLEYEQVAANYWHISEHNATLLGQIARLKEQLRVARSRKDGRKTRRDGAAAPIPTESHHPNMVNDSDEGSQEVNVKQEIHANLE